MGSADYEKAVKYVELLEARYPYGRYAQQAQLEVAYAYYKSREPASAIALGGCLRDIESGRITAGSIVTCTLTGHGLKDPDTAIKQSAGGVIEIPAESDAVKRAILEHL